MIKRFPAQREARSSVEALADDSHLIPAHQDECIELLWWVTGDLLAACRFSGLGFQGVKIGIFFGLVGG